MPISETKYKACMEAWAEWCLSGQGGARGYPKGAAFVHDKIDQENHAIPLVDNYPLLEQIDQFVGTLAKLKVELADCLRAYWGAKQKWVHVEQFTKARDLGMSDRVFRNKALQANLVIKGLMVAAAFKPALQTAEDRQIELAGELDDFTLVGVWPSEEEA